MQSDGFRSLMTNTEFSKRFGVKPICFVLAPSGATMCINICKLMLGLKYATAFWLLQNRVLFLTFEAH